MFRLGALDQADADTFLNQSSALKHIYFHSTNTCTNTLVVLISQSSPTVAFRYCVVITAHNITSHIYGVIFFFNVFLYFKHGPD